MFKKGERFSCICLLGVMFVSLIPQCVCANTVTVEEFNVAEILGKLSDESLTRKERSKIRSQIWELPLEQQTEVLDALIDKLHHSNSRLLKSRCAYLISTLKRTEAVSALAWTLLNDRDRFIRGKAARCLGKTGSEKAIPALEAAIKADTGTKEDGTPNIEGCDIA